MIVKFHARGRGGGSGPVDYLLGRDRQRPGAAVLQGKPEEVRELIDASPYAKKYTSGVLSFAEAGLPEGLREKVMRSFEQALLPGLARDQYSVLWVEHTDKGRLELNFLVPNTELLTGKRLQPYYDRADRPRIDAWQTVVNAQLHLHDPNAPENRRALVTPSNLPETKQEAAETITRSLLRLCEAGEIRTRQDVIQALSDAGFEVVRETRNSISLADPDGGRNIRLKGAIYEQSFTAGDGLRAEIESAGQRYRAEAESRVQRARESYRYCIARKRGENQRRYPRPQPGTGGRDGRTPENGPETDTDELALSRRRAVPDDMPVPRGDLVHRASNRGEPGHTDAAASGDSQPGEEPGRAEAERLWRDVLDVRRPGVRGDQPGEQGVRFDRRGATHLPDTGEQLNDRAGEAAAERVRATATGLQPTSEGMGERLRGIADDVYHYTAGQRATERSGLGLESAGRELERAAPQFQREIKQAQEYREEQERQALQQRNTRRVSYGPGR